MPCKPLRRAGRSMSHTCVSGKNNYDDYYAHADGHGANYDDVSMIMRMTTGR